MRKLTREQMNNCDCSAWGEIILDGSSSIFREIDIFLKQEKSKIPLEAQIHLDYLTCHKDVLFEITFIDKEEKKESITDGLRPTLDGYPLFHEGYYKALDDVRKRENAKAK